MIEIFYPGQQKQVKLDAEDFGVWSERVWSITQGRNTRYLVATKSMLTDGNRKRVYLHRAIMNVSSGFVVDHKNGDGFDNRKSNLRVCNYSQNNANRKKYNLKCSSKYKGVSWRKSRSCWQACIKVNGVEYRVSGFKTELEAAHEYDRLAKKHFGDFACVNF